MRGLWTAILIGWTGVTLASSTSFDAVAWNAKRQRLLSEAERLKIAYTNCVAQLQDTAEGVTISVETYPDGAVKTLVSAKRAQIFLDTGMIWAEDIVLRKLKEDGAQDAVLEAKSCVIDRIAKVGWAKGEAKLVQGSTTFSGEDVFFSSPDRYVKVFDKADLESHDIKTGGLRP